MPYQEFQPFTKLPASEVNTLLMNQSVMTFDDATERDAQITAPVEGMFAFLKDTDALFFYNGTAWQALLAGGGGGYIFREQVIFTSSGTFTPADYSYLRAIRVRVNGGGGGGGSASALDACAGGGGGGGYAEGFITDISSLGTAVTVTIGAAGAAGTASGAGGDGGSTSFGTEISAGGGSGGQGRTTAGGGLGGSPGTGSGGDINRNGQSGFTGLAVTPRQAGRGGDSQFGRGGVQFGTASGGIAGNGFGGGGSGGVANSATVRDGGAGAPGIVILDLFE
jgi:hypothetical protein